MRRESRFGLCVFTLLVWISPVRAAEAILRDGSALVRDVFYQLDARLALMPEVAAAKWIAGQPVSDPVREKAVIQSAGDAAARRGLARAPVEALFEQQIALARESQSTRMERWRQEGTGPTTARSLRDDLRPAIDQLTQELLRSLALAAPYIASTDLETIAAILSPERWSVEDRKTAANLVRAIRLEAPRTPNRVIASGVLRIGVPADYAPFARSTQGQLVGADIELTLHIAKTLGLQPVYVRSSWASLLGDLDADRFDLAAGGISITDARRVRASFSRPLVSGGKTAIGRCSDRDRFSSMERIDQPDVRVIENPGGTNEIFARRMLSRAHLTIHPENLTIFQELVDGRADVMYTDDLEIAHVEHIEPRLCRLLSAVFDPTEKALLLPLGDEWGHFIGPALDVELDSGEYRRSLDHAISH
jgi:cyclohexadienyl dehydratase